MKIDLFERNFTTHIHAHHDHAGDPSKENIASGFHDIERIVRVFFAFGPVGTDKGPVGAAEPGVEGVFVAVIGDAADFDFLKVGASIENPLGGLIGFGLVEHRDSDAPRDLAGDVPILEILKVINQDLLFVGWCEFDFAGFKMFDSVSGEALDVDKPLSFKHRLDDGAAFVTVSDGVNNLFLATEKTLVFEIF